MLSGNVFWRPEHMSSSLGSLSFVSDLSCSLGFSGGWSRISSCEQGEGSFLDWLMMGTYSRYDHNNGCDSLFIRYLGYCLPIISRRHGFRARCGKGEEIAKSHSKRNAIGQNLSTISVLIDCAVSANGIRSL